MEKETIRVCDHHGETVFVLEGRGYYRCKKCRSAAVSRKRRKIKLRALEYKGGKCEVCGYDRCIDALEFHHLTNKSFGLSEKGHTRSWDTIQKELDKCVLLCANCHRERHAEEKDLAPW